MIVLSNFVFEFNKTSALIAISCMLVLSFDCVSASTISGETPLVLINSNVDHQYTEEWGVTSEDSIVFERELASAQKGNIESEHTVGLMYFNGKGTQANVPAAIRWFEKAAKKGNANSQNDLGAIYKNANGVARDCKVAMYWLQKAVKQKHPLAYYNMGDMNIDGMCMEPDGTQAVYWYMKAANKNNHIAQYKLGIMYAMGDGVLKDLSEAKRYFIESCRGGEPKSCMELKNSTYYR